MKKIIILLFIAVSLFAQFKFQRSLPDRYTVFLLGKSYNGSNTFKDYSQYNNTITTYGDTKQLSKQYKFDNGAIYFDGGGDYLTIPDNELWTFGDGNFTVEGWFYCSSNDVIILPTQGTSEYASKNFPFFIKKTSSNYLAFTLGDGTNFYGYYTASTTMPLNQWVHIAFVRNGNTFTLYQNGVNVLSQTQNITLVNASTPLTIGRAGDYYGFYYQGYMQGIKITKGIVLYTSNFTPPNKPY